MFMASYLWTRPWLQATVDMPMSSFKADISHMQKHRSRATASEIRQFCICYFYNGMLPISTEEATQQVQSFLDSSDEIHSSSNEDCDSNEDCFKKIF